MVPPGSLKKDYDKAIADYDEAIRLDPNCQTAYYNRGIVWEKKKDFNKAISDYNEAIRLDPKYSRAYNREAWLKATCPDDQYRNGKEAVELATRANELTAWAVANNLNTLAAAFAEAGDFDSAIKYQSKAIDLNSANAKFVKGAKEHLALYKSHKPIREQ